MQYCMISGMKEELQTKQEKDKGRTQISTELVPTKESKVVLKFRCALVY